MELGDLMVIRGAERLLIVAVAGLSIFLGYMLFKIVPVDKNSSGEFKALNMSIVVSKVGPGVFFAAFGAIVLGTSVMTQLKVAPSDTPQQLASNTNAPEIAYSPQIAYQVAAPETTTYTYAADEGAVPAKSEAVFRVKDQIAFLNCAAMMAKKTLAPGVADSMQSSVDAAGAALLRQVWQPAWGDVATLETGGAADEVEAMLTARSPACLADVLKVEAE